METKRFWLIAVLLALPLVQGCQPTTTTPQMATGPIAPLPSNRPATADEAVGSDECSIRLHDIEGALLMYYALNKQLPDSLEAIQSLADAGTQLKLTCPVSNQPYNYSPQGLVAMGNDKRIIVWDPAPSHNGMRWCIIMPHLQPGAALQADVVKIGEKEFSSFVPPIQ